MVCYPHNGGGTIEALVESCLRTKEQGWKFVRFSPNTAGNLFEPARAVRESIKMVEAVRDAVGEEIEICFDVHTRLDPADTIRFCRAVEPYHPFFIEDPIRSENAASVPPLCAATSRYRSRRESSTPAKWEFRELIENDLIDYARTDLCIVGGITEAKKVAGWAETHYIKLATHNPLGPVSSAACLALNLACNNVGVMEHTPAAGHGADQRGAGADDLGRRLSAPAGAAGPGRGIRPRSSRALALPSRPPRPPPPRGRFLHQLVIHHGSGGDF